MLYTYAVLPGESSPRASVKTSFSDEPRRIGAGKRGLFV